MPNNCPYCKDHPNLTTIPKYYLNENAVGEKAWAFIKRMILVLEREL